MYQLVMDKRMEGITIKRFFTPIILLAFVIAFTTGCNVMFSEKEYTEEEKQLMAEAKDVVKEFNYSLYMAESEDELKEALNNTWVEAEAVYEDILDTYHDAKDMNYQDCDIEVSEEHLVANEEMTKFTYTAKVTITLTGEDGNEKGYDHKNEYQFKKTDDGSYKLEKIGKKD